MKLLHLNIFKGKYLDSIIKYCKDTGFDILQFQEVAGGEQCFNGSDNFDQIQSDLQMPGEIVKTCNPAGDKNSYFGNATFLKSGIKLINKNIIWLKDFDPGVENVDKSSAVEASRAALSLEIEIDNRRMFIINSHMAWGKSPLDDDYKINQALKLLTYIKKLNQPFILTGDFNVLPETKTAGMFTTYARNLTAEYNLQYTLNPNIHFLGEKSVSEKIAVDMVFVSKEIIVEDFKPVSENLSDHLGLFLQFSFR